MCRKPPYWDIEPVMETPDLINGYIINAADKANSWRTTIHSVLCKKGDQGADEFAYLAHECRAENVSEDIFDGRVYEFTHIATWLGNFSLRHGSYCFGAGEKHSSSIYQKDDVENLVFCGTVGVTPLDFRDALDFVRSGDHCRLFMSVEYTFTGQRYQIFCPCRYINFPNSARTDDEYLQPLSGYTLFFNGERFVVSYMGAHIREGKQHSVEFIAREPIGFLDTKPKNSRLYKFLSLGAGVFNKLLVTDEFHKVYRPESSEVTFYVYP